jgi:hypothetical protein
VAVVGRALEQVEDHVGLMFAECVEQVARLAAEPERPYVEAGFDEPVADAVEGEEDFAFRLGVGVVERENRLVIEDENAVRHDSPAG